MNPIALGLAVWVEDEAGPYQTVPYPGESWQLESYPVYQPHEYLHNGNAKMLAWFHPAVVKVQVKGVPRSTNAILHPWLKEQIKAILKSLPEKTMLDEETNGQVWQAWQQGLSRRITLAGKRPPSRMLLIWDNLQGHYTPELVLWLFAQGVMPLCTPLGGSWLNMAKSIQRILVRRGLAGQNPQSARQPIEWLAAVARRWKFVWGGARAARRERNRNRSHTLGGSGAWAYRLVRSRQNLIQKWQSACQLIN